MYEITIVRDEDCIYRIPTLSPEEIDNLINVGNLEPGRASGLLLYSAIPEMPFPKPSFLFEGDGHYHLSSSCLAAVLSIDRMITFHRICSELNPHIIALGDSPQAYVAQAQLVRSVFAKGQLLESQIPIEKLEDDAQHEETHYKAAQEREWKSKYAIVKNVKTLGIDELNNQYQPAIIVCPSKVLTSLAGFVNDMLHIIEAPSRYPQTQMSEQDNNEAAFWKDVALRATPDEVLEFFNIGLGLSRLELKR